MVKIYYIHVGNCFKTAFLKWEEKKKVLPRGWHWGCALRRRDDGSCKDILEA